MLFLMLKIQHLPNLYNILTTLFFHQKDSYDVTLSFMALKTNQNKKIG